MSVEGSISGNLDAQTSSGNLNVSGSADTLTANALNGDVVFGETTAGTSLNASASGNISQTGSVTSAETTLSGVNITMSESGNELGNVSVSGESAKLVSSNGMSVEGNIAGSLTAIVESGDISFGNVEVKNLDANAKNGNILDTGALKVSENASFNASDSVELDSFSVLGNANINAGNSVLLDNMSASDSGVNGDIYVSAKEVEIAGDIGSEESAKGSVNITAADKITIQNVYTQYNQNYNIAKAGGETVNDVPLTINGDTLKSESGSIVLGSDMSGDSVIFPTIIAENSNGLSLSGQNVEMGHGQKLLSPYGGVTIAAANEAALSDIQTAGNIKVSSKTITFLSRDAMTYTDESGNLVSDRGLGFIAKKIDTGNGSTSVDLSSGGTGVVEFSAEEFLSQNISQYILLVADAGSITSSKFLNGLNIIGGIIPAGSPMVDVAQFLAAATPSLIEFEIPEETVSQAMRENLVKIGIYARENTEPEKRGSFNGMAQYFEMVTSENPQPSDYKVAEGRIESKQAVLVYEMSSDIFWDKNGEKAVSKIPEIVADISKAYGAFKAKFDANNQTPAMFAQYIDTSDEEIAQKAAKHINAFRKLFGEIKRLGLTPVELDVSKSVILRPIRVKGLSSTNLRKIIENEFDNPVVSKL